MRGSKYVDFKEKSNSIAGGKPESGQSEPAGKIG
jgi:hypothetical protein